MSSHPDISLRVRPYLRMPITCGFDSPPPASYLARGLPCRERDERERFADPSHMSRQVQGSLLWLTPAAVGGQGRLAKRVAMPGSFGPTPRTCRRASDPRTSGELLRRSSRQCRSRGDEAAPARHEPGRSIASVSRVRLAPVMARQKSHLPVNHPRNRRAATGSVFLHVSHRSRCAGYSFVSRVRETIGRVVPGGRRAWAWRTDTAAVR